MSKSKAKTLADAEAAIRNGGKKSAPAPEPTEPATEQEQAADGSNNLSFGDLADGGSAKKVLTGAVPMSDLSVQEGFNPRNSLGVLDELVASIKAEGLLSSLVVRPSTPEEATTPYIIVAGHRRFAALVQIAYNKLVPVIIRADLAGDPLRAKAVSVAENSEDGRVNLNSIEIGRVAAELVAGGWSVDKIAKGLAVHPQKVRRALKIVELPADVQSLVSSDKLAANAALEYAKLDDNTRAAVSAELHHGMTIDDIKSLRKKAEIKAANEAKAPEDNGEGSEGGEGGETGAPTAQEGLAKGNKPVLGAWKGSKQKQAQITELARTIANATPEEQASQDYYEVRGALAALLWDRGDIDRIVLPADDSKKKEDRATLKAFNHVVQSAQAAAEQA